MKKILVVFTFFSLFPLQESHAAVIIAELYGGGGNTGATFQNDYVFLYNDGGASVNLSTWSLQYASATGSSWSRLNLTGSIPASGYYRLKLAAGNSCSGLPCGNPVNFTPDQSSTVINMSTTAGKLALVDNQTSLTGTCPSGSQIMDFVGFGSTANCFEGSGPAPSPSVTTSIQKSADTNDNAVDYSVISLPIVLIRFNAEVDINSKSTILSFSTATERSTDGYRFTEIGQVTGAGDSNIPQDYSFTDTHPLPGKNYYRLKQVDFDGKYTYSKVVSVNFGKTGGLSLSPMPTSNELNVTLDKPIAEDGQWQVLDMSGRVLRTGTFPAETTDYQLNASDLLEGSFVFRLVAGQEVLVKKFWKG